MSTPCLLPPPGRAFLPRPPAPSGRGERGASLMLVLGALLLFSFLALSLLFSTDVEFRTGKSYGDSATMLSDTDNAVAEVLWRLNLKNVASPAPTGYQVTVNNLTNYNARLDPDPFGLLSNGVDDDGSGIIDDVSELSFEYDWEARILLQPSVTHPGSPYEVTDSSALAGPPWGPKIVVPTIQPSSSWRLYTDTDASSAYVLDLRYKLDTDTTVGHVGGGNPKIVYYDPRLVTNGVDDKNTLNNLGGDMNAADDSPYNITYTTGGTTYWASGSPILLLQGTSRVQRAGKNAATRGFQAELYYPTLPVMSKALCACGDFDGHGGPTTDSYNSSQGDYGAGPINHNGDIGANGNIYSDGTINGTAMAGGVITGANTVYGDCTAGGTIDTAPFGAGSQDYPNYLPVPSPCDCAKFDVTALAASKSGLPAPSDPDCNAHAPALKLTSSTVCTLTSGEYYFTSIDISGGGNLQIDASSGPVKIYVAGDAVFNGNGLTNTGIPSNCQIFVAGANVKLTGTTDVSAVIYAPLAQATLTGNANMKGAVLADSVKFGGSNTVHYDEQLASLWSYNGSWKVLNWKEIN